MGKVIHRTELGSMGGKSVWRCLGRCLEKGGGYNGDGCDVGIMCMKKHN